MDARDTGRHEPDAAPPVLPAPKLARPLDAPPAGARVLVLAPHPDDESAGPGGCLAAHAARGDRVTVVVATTGVHGDPDGASDPEAYVATRRREVEAACRELGVARLECWGYPDGMSVTERDLADVTSLLVDLFAREAPDLVYAPHEGESHADHHVLALAARRAHATSRSTARLLGYEIWSPIAAPDLVVDVTATYAKKLAALRCYPSQLRHTDIVGAIEGLNRYRAILLPHAGADGRRRAEALQEVA